ARRRLEATENLSDIGSDIQMATRDLDIRGAGDILGADQSGFINEIGYEMYQKILAEAIQEMRDTDFEEVSMADNSGLLQRECILETDIDALFPTDYVNSVSERMSLYKELDSIRDLDKLEVFRKKVVDIFGPMPRQTEELMQTVPLRMLASKLYFEKIILRKGSFAGHFIGNANSKFYQSDEFGKILTFLQLNHPQVQLKEINNKLVLLIGKTPTIKSAMHWLTKMDLFCNQNPS
ncbi:MAG: transcription-repair coupling factor, partial [Bacteroidales bacterium]|nr:transcription-repair coupling factor [Bacteroidales bacterium]